jgi:hypothetical protein
LQQTSACERARLTSAVDVIQTRYAEQQRRLQQEKATEESSLRQQVAAVEKRFKDARNQLSNEEAQVRSQSDRAIEECHSKCGKRAAQLIQQLEQVKLEYRGEVANLTKELEAAAKLSQQSAWQRERVSRKLAAYAPLTFGRYLMRMFGR